MGSNIPQEPHPRAVCTSGLTPPVVLPEVMMIFEQSDSKFTTKVSLSFHPHPTPTPCPGLLGFKERRRQTLSLAFKRVASAHSSSYAEYPGRIWKTHSDVESLTRTLETLSRKSFLKGLSHRAVNKNHRSGGVARGRIR